MLEISYDLFAIDPHGVPHPIANGSCGECAGLTAVNTGYTCVQDREAGSDCSGAWRVSTEITYEAQPGSTWVGLGPNCSAAGPLATCAASNSAGTAKLFNLPSLPACSPTATAASATPDPLHDVIAAASCYNLPPSGVFPWFGDTAIDVNIRPYHFPGGAYVDNSKGLFLSSVTDNDLAHVFEAGMTDAGSWKLNASNYYEKTFSYSGVGFRSVDFGGGLPSTKITLVVGKFGDEVITMYPADA